MLGRVVRDRRVRGLHGSYDGRGRVGSMEQHDGAVFQVARTRARDAAHDPFIRTLRVPTSIGEPIDGKAIPPGSWTT
jgi:hypothetical protein